VYVNYDNILDGILLTIKKKFLLIVRKKFGEEMNVNKTKYMVMCRDQEIESKCKD